MTLAQKIIQILLFEAGSLKISDLAKFLNASHSDISESILEVKNLLAILNLKLINNSSSLEITLSEEIHSIINKNKIEDLKSEISESALQTLAVILYKNKATKAEIDFIRGVDSGRSIKNLSTRGIIEKLEEKNKRYYTVSTESMRYLNLEEISDIPDFENINLKIKTLLESE